MVCAPLVFCASKLPSFLARWRVQRRPDVRGPAGTGSVGDSVGEGDGSYGRDADASEQASDASDRS